VWEAMIFNVVRICHFEKLKSYLLKSIAKECFKKMKFTKIYFKREGSQL
jgi:hypothetical protein